MEYLRLSWTDIQKQCTVIAKDIIKKEYNNYTIVSIIRGGLAPARILSDMLNNNEIYTVTIKFYQSVGKTAKKPRITIPLQADIKDKNILLIDDISDTGESLIVAKKHLKEKGAGHIIVATLLKKPQTKFEPDIFAKKTNAWVIFPWEINETIRDIKRSSKTLEKFKKEMEKAGIDREEYHQFI